MIIILNFGFFLLQQHYNKNGFYFYNISFWNKIVQK